MRLLALFGLFAVVGLASACMWDSDTLAMEAKGLPDVVRVVSGRFERNPPLYYEMRLKRVAAELRTKPGDLDLYDDAGVACARLGRNDEAIEWMARKLKVLNIAKARGEKNVEHWYRYHANLGTFFIHRWLHDGCKPERISDAKDAHDHIAKAIEINPDAHFGREFMQLRAIDAIVATKSGKAQTFDLSMDEDKRPIEKQIEGICGLIVLGAAWESPDIFDALASAVSESRKGNVAYLAVLRRNELLDEGKQPLVGTADDMRKDFAESHGSEIHDDAKADVQSDFKMLRDDAKAYEIKRTAYMMERLRAGRHPDTDPKFWDQWKEPPLPVIRDHRWGPILWPAGIAVWVVLMALAIWARIRKIRLAAQARA